MAPTTPEAAGDTLPPACQIIEVRVSELRQLFNAIDPSPFHQRDLDPRAEEFIVGWSKELRPDKPLGLVVHLSRGAGRPDEADALRDAVHLYFSERAKVTRRSLRELLRRGRLTLAIGLAFLAVSIGISDLLGSYSDTGWPEILRQGFSIIGWVAMWRPLEIVLYDWWPILADARLLDRLASMPVRIVYEPRGSSDAWRADWPEVDAHVPHSMT